jgi:hypothetical protein
MKNEEEKLVKPEDRLKQYLAERSGLQVFCEWKPEIRAFRFYFQESSKDNDWKYIVDVSVEDVSADTELSDKLESAGWLSKVSQDSGKSVALFESGKFATKRVTWPSPHTHSRAPGSGDPAKTQP